MNLYLFMYTLLKIFFIIFPLLLCVAYYTYLERKVIGFIQLRIGPHRVGFYGLLQPIADALKLLFKEIIFPEKSNKFLFILAPILSITPSLLAWAFIPFTDIFIFSNLKISLLFLFTISSIGVYGIIIAGWSSNSKYALFGSMRSLAQMISYEIVISFVFVGIVFISKSLNLQEIVLSQHGGIFCWYFIPLFPLFIIFWISSVAETNRAPFDVAEGESEIVAGFHVDYAGMGFAIFFLAEYANMILVSVLCTLLFFGGWLSPFEGSFINKYLLFIPDFFWLCFKASFFIFSFIWYRATFPRYRYDQIMFLCWKVFLPITFIWIFIILFLVRCDIGPWSINSAQHLYY